MKRFFSLFATIALLLFSCQQEPVIEDDGRIVLSIQKEGKKVETSSIDFIGEGGTIEVGLTCKGDWTVNAAPSSWLSVSPTSGTDDATLSVKALVNTDRDSRLGAVIVTCGDDNTTLTVTQSGTWLELSTDSMLFASAGGNDTLTISSNVAWEVITEESWLKVSTASGKGDATLVVTAADNASPSARKGNITISSDGYYLPITIMQDARYLVIDTETIHFANEGGCYDVAVDDDGTFDVTSDVEWLTFEKQEKGFTVVAAENATPNTRNATITVFLSDLTEGTMERTISVSQDSRYLNVGASFIRFANAGGRSEDIAVYCNGVFDVRSDVDWLTFEKQEESFIAIATDNATPFTRTATIMVFLSDLIEGTLERTITVSQEARYLNVGSTNICFASTGGYSEIVSIDCNGAFDVRSDADWLTFEKQEESFRAFATDNSTLNNRNTIITVFLTDLTDGTLERTITVSQEGRYLNVGSTTICFVSTGGYSEIVSIDCNGAFDVRSDADWLTFEKQEESFIAIATDNATLNNRNAIITVFLTDLTDGILERTITVSQEARYLDVKTTSIRFAGVGGNGETVFVDCNGTFDVKSDMDWLTLEKHEESFIAIATNNTTLYTRKATITVFLSDLLEGTLKRTVYAIQDVIPSGEENGHEWINLGLPSGTLWATCNVGASTPSDKGEYFAWGETEAKSDYSWENYKWCNGSNISLTKYNFRSEYGKVDDKGLLELSDDAAAMNWGGSWCIPNMGEWEELANTENCTWTRITQNGQNGYKVTSKVNSNSLFLPAAGFYGINGFWGEECWYWARENAGVEACTAWCWASGMDYGGNFMDYCNGLTVRPVCHP